MFSRPADRELFEAGEEEKEIKYNTFADCLLWNTHQFYRLVFHHFLNFVKQQT